MNLNRRTERRMDGLTALCIESHYVLCANNYAFYFMHNNPVTGLVIQYMSVTDRAILYLKQTLVYLKQEKIILKQEKIYR